MTRSSLAIELHALDPSGGEAIVRCMGRWYRVYRRKGQWFLEDLGAVEPPALRWGGALMRLRRGYPSFGDLAVALTAAASSGAVSLEEVNAALQLVGGSTRAAGTREEEFLSMFQGRVDRLLARRGCSAEDAFPLLLETFRRAFLLSPMDAETLEELLPQIAIEVFREKYGDANRTRTARREPETAPASTPRDGPLQEALSGLDSLTLRCLAVCSDPRPRSPHLTREGESARLFALPEEDVRLRIGLAAARLVCSRDQLLSPSMHAAYKRELSRRLD
jgi:hypothetical protein